MSDSVEELREIQGEARHAWWLFWVGVEVWFFARSSGFFGRWSLPWVLGHIAAGLARLERLTR